MAFE
jgi:hypothetical protein